MNVKEEILALEQTRQNIIGAVNEKGGELAGNAPLNAVPQAIADLPSGGGEYVAEGKFTLTSNTYRLSFVNPTGQVPVGLYVEYLGEKADLCQARFVYTPDQQGVGTLFEYVASSNNFTLHNIKLVDTMSGSSAEFTLGANECVVRARAGSRTWLAGEYKFKLFFEGVPDFNIKMLEGEVTLASETNTMYVYYTNAKPPIYAIIELVGGERENNKSFGGIITNAQNTGKNYRAIFFQYSSGVLTSAVTFVDYGTGIYNNRIAFAGTRNYVVGTYRYKLFFEL